MSKLIDMNHIPARVLIALYLIGLPFACVCAAGVLLSREAWRVLRGKAAP